MQFHLTTQFQIALILISELYSLNTNSLRLPTTKEMEMQGTGAKSIFTFTATPVISSSIRSLNSKNLSGSRYDHEGFPEEEEEWRGGVGSDCVALAASKISLFSPAGKRLDDLIDGEARTLVRWVPVCEGSLKVLNFYLGSEEDLIRFSFLLHKDLSFELSMVEVVHNSTYLSFPTTNFQDPRMDLEPGTSFSCREWKAVSNEEGEGEDDGRGKKNLIIQDLQFQIFTDTGEEGRIKDAQRKLRGSGGRLTFGTVGGRCLGEEEIDEKGGGVDPFRVSLPIFLLNMGLLLGIAGLAVGLTFTLNRMYPEKFKKFRKVVFKV